MVRTSYWQMIRQAGQAWQGDKAFRMAAALAYYSLFSMAPLLLIAISIAGMAIGEAKAREAVVSRLAVSIGDGPAAALGDVLKNAQETGGNTLFTVLGSLVLLFGASGVFIELQDQLNTIWKVPPRPGLGLTAQVRTRLLSLAIILGGGLLLLVILAVNVFLVTLVHFLSPVLGEHWASALLGFVLPTLVVTVLFAVLYKVLPDTRVRWGDVWLGALGGALLYELGRYGLSMYLGYVFASSAFGAAAAPIVLLSWIYYSSLMFLFGAEFTRVHALQRAAGPGASGKTGGALPDS
jgi:membrane protein